MAPFSKASEVHYESRLREKRQALGLSQTQLASMAGITRQAVGAIESNQYSPATSVALQLARALRCRVEDLFSIGARGEIVEGEFLGPMHRALANTRVQASAVGDRLLIRPLDGAGELAGLASSADGLIAGGGSGRRVKIKLLKARESLRHQAVIGGCDPAMFLAAEHMRHQPQAYLVPCLMGNSLALAALRRGELHAAGVHGDSWRGELRRLPVALDCVVVTFAHWQQGIIVRAGNPKKIRSIADFENPRVKIVNREKGSGARRLLDQQAGDAGLPASRIKGYEQEVLSHLEIAARVKAGHADAGIGVRAAAAIYGLDFVPVQRERYDLIIPKTHYENTAALRALLDTIVSRPFRDELEALGDYDTRETGRVVEMSAS
jgi:molybdate-binding protein/DNA-binding XRE family transcriptional regulator